MPDATGTACEPALGGANRTDLPVHTFSAANNWVLRAIRNIFPDSRTGLTAIGVEAAIARNESMLDRASDCEASIAGSTLNVRIINQTGHKLPTGYPEGRRMWINVKFFNGASQLLAERGAYNAATALLSADDTKVYEGKLGISADLAPIVGQPAGVGFHFALNNVWLKDNRIPPRGFTNAGFTAVQAAPVDYSYADGQYWDDTSFTMPVDTSRVEVRVFYQVASREYIEFLRDQNTTNTAGDTLYDQWDLLGKSPPALLDLVSIDAPPCRSDFDGDGFVTGLDFDAFVAAFEAGEITADYDADGFVTGLDFDAFVGAFEAGC